MERQSEVPDAPAAARFFKPNLSRPVNINPDSVNISRTFNTSITCTSSTSSSSSSPPDLVRHVQAAFKRHRPVGMMQSNSTNPRRVLAARREISKETNINSQPTDSRRREDFLQSERSKGLMVDKKDHLCITPPSESSREDTYPDATQAAQIGVSMISLSSNANASSSLDNGIGTVDVMRNAHFSSQNLAVSCEKEWVESNHGHMPDVINQGKHQYGFESIKVSSCVRSEGGISSYLDQRTPGILDHQHQRGNFLQKDLGNVMNQSSVAGSSCVNSTFNNPISAPGASSVGYSSQPPTLGSCSSKEPHEEPEVKLANAISSCSLLKYADPDGTCKSALTSQSLISFTATPLESSSNPSEKLQNSCPKEHSASNVFPQEGTRLEENNAADAKSLPSRLDRIAPPEPAGNPKDKLETAVAGKAPSTSRKRGYDPDMFFKVNGKLYQRLGKIGSGGSSEVHKVISSDCKIYALKKIKLKGRDYATAYGFCQEIHYLNRLRGKENIIQLIDYEVTDKTLLQEVMDGSMSKDGRVRDDGYVYMVLEYGEIDLAHMLSQKWKEIDASGGNASIDENWLRFYWQQILMAVNTIHKERIVHSDLKPANFLLVKGSLKLIDFGIAKAIMNDTTNIQRDSQVGTLSYMSPEAFMCNEMDANGIIIKCGLPSDIWSLGCILYQMVYGRTPFSEYKTFLSKFKVITDPTYEIWYEPVSNPWLLDLMRKCLAWDRNKRWRIPQLLRHPFLAPPIQPELPSLNSHVQSCKLLQLITESSPDDREILELCSQLQDMLMNPGLMVQPGSSASREHLCKFLYKASTTWHQLHDVFSNL